MEMEGICLVWKVKRVDGCDKDDLDVVKRGNWDNGYDVGLDVVEDDWDVRVGEVKVEEVGLEKSLVVDDVLEGI